MLKEFIGEAPNGELCIESMLKLLEDIVKQGYRPCTLKCCRRFHNSLSRFVIDNYNRIIREDNEDFAIEGLVQISRWITPHGTVEIVVLDVDMLNEIVCVGEISND